MWWHSDEHATMDWRSGLSPERVDILAWMGSWQVVGEKANPVDDRKANPRGEVIKVLRFLN
jgi:hypothetical protein